MEGFTFTTVIVGTICYILGMAFGWYVNKQGNAKAVADSYRKGEEAAQKVHREEKEALSEDLLEKLETMKDSLVSTYEAYEDALITVDKKLTPGTQEKLSLAYNQPAQIEYESSNESKTDTSKKKVEETQNVKSAISLGDSTNDESDRDSDSDEEKKLHLRNGATESKDAFPSSAPPY